MAWHLYRLGRGAFRRKWWVIAAWVAALVIIGGAGATLKGPTSDRFTLPGLESTEAFDLVKQRTPQAAPDGATARIVYHAPEGQTLTAPAARAAIAASLAKVKSPLVQQAIDPFSSGAVSRDGRTAFATVTYTKQGFELKDADKNALLASKGPTQKAGIATYIGGNALQKIPEPGAAELIGLAIAAVILLITFGTLIAAGMPIVTAVIGVGIGLSAITAATGFMELGSSTQALASMLGLAVGIDYALFIVSRYRHEVRAGRSMEDAAGRAVGTAGSAVVFAGLTVIIALVALSIVDIRFLTQMGLASAFTVAIAVLIALTLLPALFGAFGRLVTHGLRIPFLKDVDPEDETAKATFGRRWGELVTRNSWVAIGVGLVIAALLATPVASMRLALPDDGTEAAGTDRRVAYDLITDNFGPGANGPLLVVVDTAKAANPQAAIAAAQRPLEGLDGVARVVPFTQPVPPGANAQTRAAITQANQRAQGMLQQAKYATITVVPTTGPSEAATSDLVATIRERMNPVEKDTGAHVMVTGLTALGVDVSDKLAEVFPRYLAIVVGLAFVLLMLVFRSLLVPLKAVLGFLVSVGIALGVTVAVFQWGYGSDLFGMDKHGPIMMMLPILLVGILFGLAMDYEVFLVSRMREEYVHGRGAQEAVVHGFQHGARVVTAAALIMIGVFVSFALTGDAIITVIGFGLAVGILADAFLVRMTLVPAILSLMDRKAWALPKWLDRILPNLDIEGESLRRHLGDEGHGSASGAHPVTSEG